MPATLPVVVIGAGPYGLSLGAHLRALQVDFRIFGIPMESWRFHMPAGMLLKSEGFASNLYEPSGSLTLQRYCADRGLPYAPTGLPVSLPLICDYGLAFQQRVVPNLETRRVMSLSHSDGCFMVGLDDNEMVQARRVVVATGITQYSYIPPALAGLRTMRVSHSSDHGDLAGFAGRRVTVIGGGSSAIDLATLLHRGGADVRLVTRRAALKVLGPPSEGTRSVWQRLRSPVSGLGGGWKLLACSEAPMLFRALPSAARVRITRDFLGPAAGWFAEASLKQCQTSLGHQLVGVQDCGDRVRLEFTNQDGIGCSWDADHVIAATGFRPDLSRLGFLSRDIVTNVRTIAGAPELSQTFESSVRGLYFAGLAAANSFGPVMRFMLGARYTASRTARHLARATRARAAPIPVYRVQ